MEKIYTFEVDAKLVALWGDQALENICMELRGLLDGPLPTEEIRIVFKTYPE